MGKRKPESRSPSQSIDAGGNSTAVTHNIPPDGDDIDKALWAFVARSSQELKGSFDKISTGKYTYCQKKLWFKLTSDQSLVVRAGGNMVPIAEYLASMHTSRSEPLSSGILGQVR